MDFGNTLTCRFSVKKYQMDCTKNDSASNGTRSNLAFNLLEVKVEPCAKAKVPAAVQSILQDYADVFSAPTGLLPQGNLVHTIQLKEDNELFKMSPYRYPYYQKEETEKLIEEMLEQQIIQHNIRPIRLSNVVSQKKKDGFWEHLYLMLLEAAISTNDVYRKC